MNEPNEPIDRETIRELSHDIAQSESKRYRKAAKKLKTRLEEAEGQLKLKTEECADVAGRLVTAIGGIDKVKGIAKEVAERLAVTFKEKELAQSQAVEATRFLDEQATVVEDLKKRHTDQLAEIGRSKESTRSQTEQLDKLKSHLADAHAKIEDLKEANSAVRQQYEEELAWANDEVKHYRHQGFWARVFGVRPD